MKNNTLQWISLVLISFSLLLGCAKEVEVNYLLNGHDWPSSAFKPGPADTSMILSLYAGDTIIITDVSTPAKNISSRDWDIDGDGVWDDKFKNKDDFYTIFNQIGLQKTSLCINGKEQCILKWINVKEEIVFDTFSRSPTLTFIQPGKPNTKNETGYLTIKVKTQNVYAKEELQLKVGQQLRAFSFNEAEGLLTARNLELAVGENTIAVETITEEEINTIEKIVVDFQPASSSDLENSRIITTTNPSSNKAKNLEIIIAKPKQGITSTKARVRLEFKAVNVVMRSDFEITNNGKSIRNDRFNHHIDGLWKGVLKLETGKNIIEIKATTNIGSASASREIFYNDPS